MRSHVGAHADDIWNTLPQYYMPPNGRYSGFETGTAFKTFTGHFRDKLLYEGILVALVVFGDGFV
jgi:hypothetical protein